MSYEGRQAIVKSARQACERAKLDRRDIAASWRAHRDYMEFVTGAASVKADVKSAARKANLTHTRTAVRLTWRSRIDCAADLPNASLLP